jgi:hypothetical protein
VILSCIVQLAEVAAQVDAVVPLVVVTSFQTLSSSLDKPGVSIPPQSVLLPQAVTMLGGRPETLLL